MRVGIVGAGAMARALGWPVGRGRPRGRHRVGGLDRARYLEAAAALVISLLSHGGPPGSVLNWTHAGQLAVLGSGKEVSS